MNTTLVLIAQAVFSARTNKQTDSWRDWTLYPTPTDIQPAWAWVFFDQQTHRRIRQFFRSEWRCTGWWRKSDHSRSLDNWTDCRWWADRSTWCRSCDRLNDIHISVERRRMQSATLNLTRNNTYSRSHRPLNHKQLDRQPKHATS